MAKEPGLPAGVVINRAGVIGVLKKVPRDVWDHPDWCDRAKVIERSTGTRDRAEGLRRAYRILVDLEEEWAECRRQLHGAPVAVDRMTPAEVEEFAETVDTLVMLEHDPEAEPEGGLPLPTDPAELVEWAAATINMAPAPDLLPTLRAAVADRLAKQPPANEHQRYAAKAVERLAPRPPYRPRRTLDDLLTLFKAERLADDNAALTRNASNYTTPMEVLREVAGGGTPLGHIDRDTLRKVRDAILARPLAPATKRKYCRALGTIFAFAAQEKWIGADDNPALRLAPKRRKEEAEDDKRPFTADELIKLFPEGWRLDGAAAWMLALGLFQGLRAEEAAQLEVGDVGLVDGVWALFIRDWTPTEEGGRDYSLGKSLKNEASERTIPIHARIEAPLLALVTARRAAGERMLLPGVKRYGKEGFYGSIRKKVSALLVAAGVKTERTSHHSLRHNFRDACRDARIPKDHSLALGGWSQGNGAEADYGNGYTPANLAPSLDRLPFPVPAPRWEPPPQG